MPHLSSESLTRAREIVDLYPQRRSALIPLCHLAQEQDGWLRPEAIEEIAGLLDVTPAEVLGTASFYEMFKLEPAGRYVISVCTNVACMLAGAYDLLAHAEERLGVRAGGTTPDGRFTIEDVECVAHCDHAPCVQVNSRYFGPLDAGGFDRLVDSLERGELEGDVPPHGTLVRVRRTKGLMA